MVATYDRGGISFVYPENWSLNEEHPQAHAQCVTLQSPGSGFWMLQAFTTSETTEHLAAEALESVKLEYGDIEVVNVEEEIEGIRAIGYDTHFYCMDFVVSCVIRCFQLAGRTLVILCQAEDGEFDQMRRVFAAITTSLLSDAKRHSAQHTDDA